MGKKVIVRHKIWLENELGEGLLGDGKWELLKIIKKTGSLKLAIDEMGWAYRSTWDKLKTIEKRLGFKLTEKSRGGAGGGGQTQLTKEGLLLVAYFEQLHEQTNALLQKPIEVFYSKVKDIGF